MARRSSHDGRPAVAARQAGLDRFFLYGEPPREAEIDFMHVERIGERSRLHDWTIRPHAHLELHQFLYVLAGGGTVRVEGHSRPFRAPALIVVPAGTVHGFAFLPDTDGFVVTAAGTLVEDAGRGSAPVADLLRTWLCVDDAMQELAAHDLPGAFEALAREFVWSGPARLTAIGAHLARLLVGASRLALEARPDAAAPSGPDDVLATRFREIVERDFRKNLPLGHYAAILRVRPARLSAACRRAHGQSALGLVHRRLMVEAQRLLAYTQMSVGEVALALGFVDPAYFSRFFAKRAGMPPAAFRAGRAALTSPAIRDRRERA